MMLRNWTLSVCLTSLVCLAPAAARPRKPLAEAQDFFNTMKYTQCLERTQEALRSPYSDPRDVADAYRLQGLCNAALNKRQAALEAFQRLLAIQPEAELSPDISPKLGALFYEGVALFKRHKPISLWHTPPGVKAGQALAGTELKVILEADPFGMVKAVRLRYLPRNGDDATIQRTAQGPDTFTMRLPDDLDSEEIVYFFDAVNEHGAVLVRASNQDKLFKLGMVIDAVVEPPDLQSMLRDGSFSEPEAPSVESRSAPLHAWGHAAFWTGVGLVGFGGLAAWQAKVAGDEYNDSYGEDSAALDRSRLWAGFMYTGFIAGVALVTTGIVVWTVLDDSDTDQGIQFSAGPAPSGGIVLTLGRTW